MPESPKDPSTESEKECKCEKTTLKEEQGQLEGEGAMRMEQPSSTEQGRAERDVVLEEMVILPMEPQQSTRRETENGEKEVTDNAGGKAAQLAERNGGMRRKRQLRRPEDADRRVVFEEMDVFKMFEEQEAQKKSQSEKSSQDEQL